MLNNSKVYHSLGGWLLAAVAVITACGQDVLRRHNSKSGPAPPNETVCRRLPPVTDSEVPSETVCRRLPPITDCELPSDPVCRRLPPVDMQIGEKPISLPKSIYEDEVAASQRGQARYLPVRVGAAEPPTKAPSDWESLPPPIPGAESPDAQSQTEDKLSQIANSPPWWDSNVELPLRTAEAAKTIDVNALVIYALQHSSQVRAISDNYLIQRTAITEAAAAFDVRTFTDTRFIQVNEPVGNTLTTGGPPRFLNENFKASAGVRKKTASGGTLELSQRFGLQASNSVFFQPIQQGNSRLALSFTQPLLNKAGQAYNSSVITLAELDTRMAVDQTSQELQDHLLKVTKAYWELRLARTALMQKQRLYERGKTIQIELDARQDVDASQNQLVRARAAVSSRRAELARAEATIKNAEARIRALVNAPELLADVRLELVPTESPAIDYFAVKLEDARATALQNRPEVDQALAQIQAVHVNLDVSRNDLRPVLDLVLESYLTGLQGQYDIAGSFAQQFSQGAPSYTAGLVYEYSWNNRAARARFQRRQLELRRLTEQFNASLQQLSAEVDVAVREVQTTFREMQGKREAMGALQAEMDFLTDRWKHLPGDDRSGSFLLGDLLDVQDQLAREEFAFAKAQTDYTLALAELKRVTGTLLQHEQITSHEIEEDGTPRLIFDKPVSVQPRATPPELLPKKPAAEYLPSPAK